MIGSLPRELVINGEEHAIRTDYREILNIFQMFNDNSIEADDEKVALYEKWLLCFYLLFPEFESVDDVEEALYNGFSFEEAVKQAQWFFSANMPESETQSKPVFDWEHDEQMIFSAVNDVAKKEVREVEYMHWWTFMGYFNQLKECLFTTVMHIRRKKNKGEKLEKHEKDFVRENASLFELPNRVSKERQDILDRLNNGDVFT